MTPVATPVALRATSWDAALAETLSEAADHASADGARSDGCFPEVALLVHSVHRRVLNLEHDGTLISVADDSLDDAPATIRVPVADWSAFDMRPGATAHLTAARLRIATDAGDVEVLLGDAVRWNPEPPASAPIALAALSHVVDSLAALPRPVLVTPFGRASAELLTTGIRQLQSDCLARLSGGAEADAAVTGSAARLLGLGEGLTPSGDDVLTGLALVATHPGFSLTALRAPLAASAAQADARTTLLSAVTLRAAVRGRGRQCLHELLAAIAAGDSAAMGDAISRTLEIGHTSGHDILTGIRLGLELAVSIHPENRSSEGDH